MKKFFKPLIIVLLLGALSGILAFSASADSKVVVETYDKEGGALIGSYQDGELAAKITSDVGYVKCYGDVTVNADITLSNEQILVIDLGGNRITSNKKLMVGGSKAGEEREKAALTLKNGSMTVSASVQAVQPRLGSSLYFDNMVIDAYAGQLVYDGGSKVIAFNDCTVNLHTSYSKGLLCLSNGLLKNAENEERSKTLVKPIVFNNTCINNPVKTKLFYIKKNDNGNAQNISISFVGNSSIDFIGDAIMSNETSAEGEKYVFNFTVGNRFGETAGIASFNRDVVYYDSITLDEKMLPTYGKETAELIFGDSADATYPYMLCKGLCSVSWVVKGETETVEGYALGLKMVKSAVGGGMYFNPEDGGRVYTEQHIGWSLTEDGASPLEEITLSEEKNTFYAVFRDVRANIAELSSDRESVLFASASSELTSDVFANAADGSVIVLYENMSYASDEEIVISDKSLTLDLLGNKLIKNRVESASSGRFNLSGSAALTVMNGTVVSSRTGFAYLGSQASELVLDGLTVSYDSYVPFEVREGYVSINNCVISASDGSGRHMFDLAMDGGTAAVDVTSSVLDASFNNIFQYTPMSGVADISVALTETYLFAKSVFGVYEPYADRISPASSIDFAVNNSCIDVEGDVLSLSGVTEADGCEFVFDSTSFVSYPTAKGCNISFADGQSLVKYNDGSSYPYKSETIELDLKASLNLSRDFALALFVPADSGLCSLKLGDEEYTVDGNTETESVEGVSYYKLRTAGLSPSSAFEDRIFELGFNGSDDASFTVFFEYNCVDYFEKLLTNETDSSLVLLAASAVDYAYRACVYTNTPVDKNLSALVTDERYTELFMQLSCASDASCDLGNLSVALDGASLLITDSLNLRFALNPSYSGTLNIDGHEYTVKDGKVGELGYIDCTYDAFKLSGRALTITGERADMTAVSGSYGLSDYVEAVGLANVNDEPLRELLLAIESYCYYAGIYTYGGIVPPYIDDTPVVEVSPK